MTIKIEPLNQPTASVSGFVVTNVNGIANVSTTSQTIDFGTKIRTGKGGKTVSNDALTMFKQVATVTLRTTYRTKDYNSILAQNNVNTGDKGGTRHVVIGPNPHGSNEGRADIYYTLNGKDPKRTKNYVYKNRPLILRTNTVGDKIVLKARVYRMGTWSPVSTFEFKIINKKGQDQQFQSNILENELLTTDGLRKIP